MFPHGHLGCEPPIEGRARVFSAFVALFTSFRGCHPISDEKW